MSGFTAFIPARSGSKRVPNKNIRELNFKPLAMWTVDACLSSKKVGKVIFSTDSLEYWNIISERDNSGKLKLHLRSNEEAGDKVKIFDYLQSHVEEIFSEDDENVVMALPTTPFRTSQQIDEAVHLFESGGRPVFSATEYSFPPTFAFSWDENGWHALIEESPMITGNTRSQDQSGYFHPNGAIYVRRLKDLRSGGLTSLYEGAAPFFMDRLSSVDIDDELDFKLATQIAKLWT